MEKIIDSNGNEIIVAPFDLGKLQWKEAVAICKENGDNWRLPTIEELMQIYKHRQNNNLKDFENDIYWSCEILNEAFVRQNEDVFNMIGMVKTFDFRFGIHLPGDPISNKNFTRLVKSNLKPVTIKFEHRCRKCLFGSSVPESILFYDNVPFKFSHSEYYAGIKLKESLNKKCFNCGSNEIEYFDVFFNDKKLFDENKYKSQLQNYFEIFIDNNNGEINKEIIGAKQLSSLFRKELMEKLEDIKTKYSNEEANNLNHGNFLFCFRGYYNGETPVYRIEKMVNSGVPFVEIENMLNNIIKILKTNFS
jgi:hypothetical protein